MWEKEPIQFPMEGLQNEKVLRDFLENVLNNDRIIIVYDDDIVEFIFEKFQEFFPNKGLPFIKQITKKTTEPLRLSIS